MKGRVLASQVRGDLCSQLAGPGPSRPFDEISREGGEPRQQPAQEWRLRRVELDEPPVNRHAADGPPEIPDGLPG